MRFYLGAAVALIIAVSTGNAGRSVAAAPDETPATYYWEGDRLAEARRSLKAGEADAEVAAAAESLRQDARAALRRKPPSVVEKEATPPSGDKHDYLSYGVYWWPDPSKPDGKPFVRRDGYTNQAQRAQGDRDRLKTMIEDVETLALAHYLFCDEEYGEHARRLVRTWFIEPETRMNPHLKYAQAVVGVAEGRGSGIIDTRAFAELLDSIVLLEQTGALTEADAAALDTWFADYLQWLLTSDLGRDERAAENNHGNWYAAQAARIALHVGDVETAKSLLEEVRKNRLAAAIDGDGKQPEELKRTRSLHYSLFNLAAFAYLARIGESLGVDLWNYADDGRGSMKKAFLFAAPYVLDQDRWPYEQVHSYDMSPQTVQLLRMAAARYDEPVLREVWQNGRRREPQRNYAPLLFALPGT